jgi:hypothetical protein
MFELVVNIFMISKLVVNIFVLRKENKRQKIRILTKRANLFYLTKNQSRIDMVFMSW